MKIMEHDTHITELIGKPYFERGVWNQKVNAIVGYKMESRIISHRDYNMIIALKPKRLSVQQPIYFSNVTYF